jgi:cytochrome c oxidase assembly protein subunit 15
VVVPQVVRSSLHNVPKEATPKQIGYWLLGMSGLVAGMVTVGGITRLTRSGLSMTDWKLQGTLPPMNYDEWMIEFDRYKQFPEWQQRKNMTLDEFKFIFFWEYGHRMMGRMLGVAFTGPLIYFAARGMIPRHLYPRMALLFGLGGSQGLIGWWMVKSGLGKDVLEGNKEIRVSPYRLATHLSMAFTTYGTLLWTALEILKPTPQTLEGVMTKGGAAGLSPTLLKAVKKVRGMSAVNLGLVAATALSGAYVAGNDAGRAYNTFPKMGDEWIPEGMYTLEPVWRNFVENTAAVQFDHRVLALTTLGSITSMFVTAKSAASGVVWKQILPRYTQLAMHSAAGMVLVQVGLGISTLLLYVPTHLAATHQFGSLVLLTFSTATLHSLKFVKLLDVPASSANPRVRAAAVSVAGLIKAMKK